MGKAKSRKEPGTPKPGPEDERNKDAKLNAKEPEVSASSSPSSSASKNPSQRSRGVYTWINVTFLVALVAFWVQRHLTRGLFQGWPTGQLFSIKDVNATTLDHLHAEVEVLFRSNVTTVDDLFADKLAMGPSFMLCSGLSSSSESGGGGARQVKSFVEKGFLGFPADGRHAGILIKSLSKVYMAIAFLALQDRLPHFGMSLNSTMRSLFPEEVCQASILADTPIWEFMNMRSPLDMRIRAVTELLPGSEADLNGYPPFCDALNMTADECVTEVICPFYRHEKLGPRDIPSIALAPFAETPDTRADIDFAVNDDTEWCRDHHTRCPHWARLGLCVGTKDVRYMRTKCFRSCNMCVNVLAGNDTENRNGQQPEEWRYKPQYRFQEIYSSVQVTNVTDSNGNRRIRMDLNRTMSMDTRYDNYGYTVIDAVVTRATGQDLLHWFNELVATPLGLLDTIRCTGTTKEPSVSDDDSDSNGNGHGIKGCYGQVFDPETVMAPERWPLHEGGPLSKTWAGVTMLSSPHDMVALTLMLLNNGVGVDMSEGTSGSAGKMRGPRVISEASARWLTEIPEVDPSMDCQVRRANEMSMHY